MKNDEDQKQPAQQQPDPNALRKEQKHPDSPEKIAKREEARSHPPNKEYTQGKQDTKPMEPDQPKDGTHWRS